MSNNNPRQLHNGESAQIGNPSGAPELTDNDKKGSRASDGYPIDTLTKDDMTQEHSEAQDSDMIKDVWLSNFFSEMDKISKLVDNYNYVSMDTEYPGTVYVPPNTNGEFEYQMIKANCDHLKLIQVGIALSNDVGELPRGKTLAWQFNLQFEENKEQSMVESMELLRQSGFEFERHKTDGIPHQLFAEYLITSGLVLNRKNHWITFHGGVDFGYLLRILQGSHLPILQDDYLKALDTYFVNYYDCKEVKRELDLSGGLKTVAKELDVDRIGTMHQAGSDAFVTCGVYFKLRSKLKQLWLIDSEHKIEDQIKGKIYGIGDSFYDDTHYIEQYKLDAQQHQYIDTTGYVNLRLKKQGGQAASQSNNNQSYQHSNSAHGMLGTNGVGMNTMTVPSGHHSAMEMHPHSNQRNNQWVQNNQGMLNTHGMVQNQNIGMNQMNHSHSQSNTPVDMSAYNNQYNSMMHNNNIDMSNINQTNLMHMNLASFTPQMMQNQSPNISSSPSMHMFMQQQMLNQNGQNIEDPELNQQYRGMMMSHPGQQYSGGNQMYSQNNFQYQQPYHQQLLEASSTGVYASSSPSMLSGQMNGMMNSHHHSAMSSHQMQQMQQHSYYIPQSNQSGYNN